VEGRGPTDRCSIATPMQSDLVIFDCDGVLIDSEAIACRADSACLTELGIMITAEEIMERYLGISAATMCRDIEQRYGCTLPQDFVATLHNHVAAVFDTELTAIDGVEPLLQTLQYRRCVASSSAPERLRHSLSVTRLLSYFEPHIFSATQVARGKPAPDLFLFAADKMQVPPAACIVVEDSVPGVQAAVAAGMRAIGFTGGEHCRAGHAEQLHAAGAVAIAADMPSLSALLSSA
jgi:HAD superfamily hydrolase (TIGR01509 family)